MYKRFFDIRVLLLVVVSLAGCGGGAAVEGSTVTGVVIPSKVSVVNAK